MTPFPQIQTEIDDHREETSTTPSSRDGDFSNNYKKIELGSKSKYDESDAKDRAVNSPTPETNHDDLVRQHQSQKVRDERFSDSVSPPDKKAHESHPSSSDRSSNSATLRQSPIKVRVSLGYSMFQFDLIQYR